jgi:hypothetical protein
MGRKKCDSGLYWQFCRSKDGCPYHWFQRTRIKQEELTEDEVDWLRDETPPRNSVPEWFQRTPPPTSRDQHTLIRSGTMSSMMKTTNAKDQDIHPALHPALRVHPQTHQFHLHSNERRRLEFETANNITGMKRMNTYPPLPQSLVGYDDDGYPLNIKWRRGVCLRPGTWR